MNPQDKFDVGEIKNFTPHDLNIYRGSELVYTFPSMGSVRVNEVVVETSLTKDIPTVRKQYTEAAGLPDYEPGTILVVSKIVMDALPRRSDLRCPDTGPDSVVRNEKGHIIGVRRLQK